MGEVIAELKHGYISIADGSGAGSYGSSQMWFSKDGPPPRATIRSDGCGTIAAADVLAYLCLHAGAATRAAAKLAEVGELSKTGYMDYILGVYKTCARAVKHIGMLSLGVALGLERQFRKSGAALTASVRLPWSDEKLLRLIAEQLKRDVPAIMSIPPRILKRPKLTLYTSEALTGGVEYKSRFGHFVTATGLYKNDGGKRILRVSSWGKRYYLDCAEFFNARSSLLGKLSSGMVYIGKK